LARLSVEAGLDNFGLLYSVYNKDPKLWKISLRSLAGKSGGDCQQIAMHFGGGGHFGAAGFYVPKKQFKNWI